MLQANTYGVPRVAFVNKMDREGAVLEHTLNGLRTRLGALALVCMLIYMCMHTSACMHMHIYVCVMYVYDIRAVRVCVCVCVDTRMQACRAYVYFITCAYSQLYTHTVSYIHIQSVMYINGNAEARRSFQHVVKCVYI
jgi:hypothetical protein